MQKISYSYWFGKWPTGCPKN